MDKKVPGKQKTLKILYTIPTNTWPNQRYADSHWTNAITGPPCSVKYGRSFARIFLLYKLHTWLIRTGLDHRQPPQLLQVTRGHQVILILCE